MGVYFEGVVMKRKDSGRMCVSCGKPRATQTYLVGKKFTFWIHKSCAQKHGIKTNEAMNRGD